MLKHLKFKINAKSPTEALEKLIDVAKFHIEADNSICHFWIPQVDWQNIHSNTREKLIDLCGGSPAFTNTTSTLRLVTTIKNSEKNLRLSYRAKIRPLKVPYQDLTRPTQAVEELLHGYEPLFTGILTQENVNAFARALDRWIGIFKKVAGEEPDTIYISKDMIPLWMPNRHLYQDIKCNKTGDENHTVFKMASKSKHIYFMDNNVKLYMGA